MSGLQLLFWIVWLTACVVVAAALRPRVVLLALWLIAALGVSGALFYSWNTELVNSTMGTGIAWASQQLLFWIFALTTCGGAIAVVLSQNVVRMAFWLIISLGASAGLFFLLNADFVGTAQLLVYVGGTLVLLVFGVMLTASGPLSNLKTRPGELFMAGVVAVCLLGLLGTSVCKVDWDQVVIATNNGHPLNEGQSVGHGYNESEEGNTARPLGMALMGVRVDHGIGGASNSSRVGYLLPFEIASMHLLVVLIGAAYLARAKRRVTPV